MAGSNYLLDTHCLLWFQENSPKVPEHVMGIIQKLENVIYFSQVSIFEITIKHAIGKLPPFSASAEEIYLQAIKDGFTFIPIQNNHIYKYGKVPLLKNHRDPFDRLLIATATEEAATILSADEQFGLYSDLINVLW